MGTRTLFAAALITGCLSTTGPEGGAVVGPVAPPEGTYGILFVGNSLTYTNDLPGMLGTLLTSAGIRDVTVASYAFPNYGLQDHWVNPATSAAIDGGWDLVVMQQGPSATEGRPSLLEYSERFSARIRGKGGVPAMYMVWPAAIRAFDFDGVSDSYATAAERVDGLLFPAGEAWRAAWRRDPDLRLYGPDEFHPSRLGTYLAALVMFEQLTRTALEDLPLTTPTELSFFTVDTATVRVLHEAAAEANDRFARPVPPQVLPAATR